MGNFVKTTSSFANGDIAPEFYTHDNLSGLSALINMDVIAGGGLRRRAGLSCVAELDASARLISFSVGQDAEYILTITSGHINIYNGATRICDIIAPWTASDIAQIQYAQRFGTMIFVHPEYQPRTLRKTETGFELTTFEFARSDDDMTVHIPFMRFDDTRDIKITVTANSAGNNFATFTTSDAFWNDDCVGGTFLLMDKQWTVHQVTSSTVAVMRTNGAFTLPTAPITDWREAAFSTRRGWPVSITFHQDRLVFGGARDYPSGVWLSGVGRHNDFDVGTGLDDQAIFITLLSRQRQQICTVVSSDNLQILTTVGEWAIANKPLTPSSVDIKQHTSVGSVASRYLPPQQIEGATIFISASGHDIRELCLDELGESYSATDLCAYAKHLMTSPTDIAYNQSTRQLFVVMADGNMAVLNHNAALNIAAWSAYQTRGRFISVAVLGDDTYVVIMRGDKYWLEKFSSDALSDGNALPFSVLASGTPLRASGHNAARARIRHVAARVLNTRSLFINDVRADIPNAAQSASGYTGDIHVSQLGWARDTSVAPWTITSDDQLPITILSVTIYGNYTI